MKRSMRTTATMNRNHNARLAVTVLAVLALLQGPASSAWAATPTFDSVDTNEPNWVTAGYGSTAYVFFSGGGGILKNGGETNGGYIIPNNLSGGNAGAGGANLEDPMGGTFQTSAAFSTGIGNDDPVDVASFTFGAGTASTVTLGILVGANEIVPEAPLDVPILLKVSDGANSAQTVPVAGAADQPDWYFFDVTGITSGTVLTVSAARIGAIHRFNPINAVVFDAAAPVPAVSPWGGLALVLLLMASLALVLTRRRAVSR